MNPRTVLGRLVVSLFAGLLLVLLSPPSPAMARCGEVSYQDTGSSDDCPPEPSLVGVTVLGSSAVVAVIALLVLNFVRGTMSEADFTSALNALATHVSANPRPSPAVEDIGNALPVRTSNKSPTTGMFNGERIVSNEDEAIVADLRPPSHGVWPDTLISHVESHAAARMREMRRRGLPGGDEGELMLNNITCGNRGFDNDWTMSCETYLRAILPADARLTVWATPDGGLTWWTKTYIGTGEMIEP
jgi:Double-stranded DNA deaminase toxin A